MNKLHHLLTLSLAALVLAGCAGMQTDPGNTAGRAASELSAEGNHAAASRAYLDLAVESSGEQRERYLIISANELYLANDLEGADRILQEVGDEVAPANLELWARVAGQLRLAQSDPKGALKALNQVTQVSDPDVAAQILLLRAEALFRMNQPEYAVATLLQREALLSSDKDVLANQRQIWSGLQSAGASIPAEPSAADDPVQSGWMELGYIAYSNRASITTLSVSLQSWRELNPEHPASGALLDEVLEGLSTLTNYPNSVAVLLPLSGRQKTLGEAIRDGYLAAHYSLGESTARPEIRFYDTARNGVTAAYQQAYLNNAEFIIGPLLKKEVAVLTSLEPDVPTIALNYGPDSERYASNFYQFALSPEDEARAAANKAIDEGNYNAVALVPESDWGARILEAFSDELERRGGRLLASRSYTAADADFAEVIRDILLLDESYGRRNRLQANLGEQLEFTPRRRQDVDLVFIAANSAKGKQIRPQLKFHYAADLPTYATSAIYQPGSTDNSDLNGVMFPDIPWLLNPSQAVSYDQATFEQLWGNSSVKRSRYYAMGYDAYHLSAVLNSSRRVKNLNMRGMSGELYLDRDGRLHRRLPWAKMERGQPRTLPDAPRSLVRQDEIIVN